MRSLEVRRTQVQADLDLRKTQRERNALGQFATPEALAMDVLASARTLLGGRCLRFMDPAFGTGSFYSALLRVFPKERIVSAHGYEVDSHYGEAAAELWGQTGLDLELRDFTAGCPPKESESLIDLLVCNPPYVRHHHLDRAAKERLAGAAEAQLGIRVSGLSGLYVYFMLLSHRWLSSDALSIWLVPSEFMDVNYGSAVKTYLLRHVDLIRIHRFDPSDVQFGDALVSSAVVWFRNRAPRAHSAPEFTVGGTILSPRIRRQIPRDDLVSEIKWTRFPDAAEALQKQYVTLADLFSIKRGIATGANKFFLLDALDVKEFRIPSQFLRPILPGPRYVPEDVVRADPDGLPVLERRLWLFDCRAPLGELERTAPDVAAYVRLGESQGVNLRYLASRRAPWYAQEDRDPAPILCTYMGRPSEGGSPFRVILNHSDAVATNVYLMLYPKAALGASMATNSATREAVWRTLRRIVAEHWGSSGRVYGGGLHKVEPSELGRLPATSLVEQFPDLRASLSRQLSLL